MAIEPLFQKSKQGIEEMMIHLCQSTINTYKENAIWYRYFTHKTNETIHLFSLGMMMQPIARALDRC